MGTAQFAVLLPMPRLLRHITPKTARKLLELDLLLNCLNLLLNLPALCPTTLPHVVVAVVIACCLAYRAPVRLIGQRPAQMSPNSCCRYWINTLFELCDTTLLTIPPRSSCWWALISSGIYAPYHTVDTVAPSPIPRPLTFNALCKSLVHGGTVCWWFVHVDDGKNSVASPVGRCHGKPVRGLICRDYPVRMSIVLSLLMCSARVYIHFPSLVFVPVSTTPAVCNISA
jgi:hypothetical protein